jgi:tetratricopeptide (TPR) repeat protein
VAANLNLGAACVSAGDYRPAEEHFRKVLGGLEGDRRRERFGQTIFPAVAAAGYLAWIFAGQGRFREGIEYGQQSLRLAETLDHPYSLAFALWALARPHIVRGDFGDAAGLHERGTKLSRQWNLTFLSVLNTGGLGYACAFSGRIAEGIALLKEALSANEAAREGAMMLPLSLIYLSEAYLLADRLDDALAFAGRALAIARECGHRAYEAPALRLVGEVSARRDPAGHADAHYRDALALAEELGMRPLVAHCHLGLARLCRRTGKRDEARDHLAAATTMYREMDMGFWLQQAEAAPRR